MSSAHAHFKSVAAVWLIAVCATLAADPSTPDGGRYGQGGWARKKFEASVQRVAEMNGQCDIIFIGDSLTEMWTAGSGQTVWKENYQNRKALCFGIGGDTTSTLLWRLGNTEGLDKLSPKVAVLLIGVNNFYTKEPPEGAAVAQGVRKALDTIQTLWPQCKIILNAVPPNGRHPEYFAPGIKAMNEQIKTFADGSKIYFLDWGAALQPVETPEGPSYTGLSKDRIHLDGNGYKVWAEQLNPMVNRILGAR